MVKWRSGNEGGILARTEKDGGTKECPILLQISKDGERLKHQQ